MISLPKRRSEYIRLLDVGLDKIQLPKRRAQCLQLWNDASHDFVRDLKNAGWLRGLGWFGAFIWFFGLVVAAIMTGLRTLFLSTDTACQPDGSFRLRPDTYSMWSSSGFFQITLGGGHLTFAQAKVVDIVFDVGVGRGGQFLLAYVSWKVFARYLTICMEVEPITYQLFRTIFFEKEASLPSTFLTIRGFIYQRKLRSKIAMVFMGATMIFILAFPTLTSAMSGYDANTGSYVPDYDNGTLLPFSSFNKLLYIVHDGYRINKTGDYQIEEDRWDSNSDPVLSSYTSACYKSPYYDWDEDSYYIYLSLRDECRELNSISGYVDNYGLGAVTKTATIFYEPKTKKNITIPAPALNISGYDGAGGKSSDGQSGLIQSYGDTWARGNVTFNITYIEEFGSCQTLNSYQWGFSFLQLFFDILFLIIWTLGIYIMCLRTHLTMRLRERHPGNISGEHRSVLELAEAMRYELDLQDVDVSATREKQLNEQVNKNLKGGAISYSCSAAKPRTYSIRKGLGDWFRREKWWFSAISITSVACSTLWMSGTVAFWIWTFGLWIGQFWAFCICTTIGSRVLMIVLWCVAFVIIALPVTAVVAR